MSLGSKLAGFGRYCLMAFLLFLLLISAFLWYVTTDSFQQLVRARLISSIEHATGGRVELEKFHVVPLRFQLEVKNLTIHGREAPTELPLAHVDSMSAIVKVSSLLGARIGFHSLTLDHPVIHVIFYPDGSTNEPAPERRSTSSDFTRLFAISVDRLEVRRGEALWQDQRVPIEFVSDDVSIRLNYSFLHLRYSGDASVGKAETTFNGYRPVAWGAHALFSLDRNGVQVQSLVATAESSKLQLAGTISDLRDPHFAGSYDVLLNLTQAGSIVRNPHLKSGTLELRGSGSWSRETFSTQGGFDLRDTAWQDQNFFAKGASAGGKFALDPQKIHLSRIEGRFLRGVFTSDVEVSNWQTSGNHLRNSKSKEEQHGIARIKANGVSLADLLASLGPKFRPARDLRFAGDLAATSEILWRESPRNAEISADVSVTRPPRLLPGQSSLTASSRLHYKLRPAALEIEQLSANTASSQLHASGSLSNTAAFRISFVSTDVREWQPVISALFPSGLPVIVRGRAAFNGSANGALSNLDVAGNLQLEDFDAFLPKVAGSFHGDSLVANVQLSPYGVTAHDAVVHSGESVLKFDGNVSLFYWQLTGASALHLRADVQNADAAQVGKIARSNLSLAGQLNGHIDASGTLGRPQGQGALNWSNGSINGYAFDSASADFGIQGSQASFSRFNIVRGQSEVSGNGTYDLASERVQIALAGKNFDLAELAAPTPASGKVQGRLDFSADVAGTRASPDVTAHVKMRNVAINGQLGGDFLADAVTHGADLQVTGHSEFQAGTLSIRGDVNMRDQWMAGINLHFAQVEVVPFLGQFAHSLNASSIISGDVSVQGPLRNPQQLTITANLGDLNAMIEKVKLHNQGPLQFALSNKTLRVQNFHLAGDNTDLSLTGRLQLSGDRRMEFDASGNVGLQLVTTYDPDLSGAGSMAIQGHVSGTLSSPVVRGRLQIQNGSLSDINLPSALSAMNGTLLFSQNQVTVESLTAQTGGGNISFTGHAELMGKQVNFDVAAAADAVRLRYPPGVSSTATASVRWSGNSNSSLLSGDITVMKLGVTPGFDFGAYLQRSIQSSTLPQTDPVLNKIRLDLHVATTPELQMQTSVLRLRGEADLRVRGNAAKPVLLGRADIFEGQAYFNGTKYRLERGGVTFGTPAANNPAGTIPYVDFEATTRVQDYDITLSINGPADRPKLTYRSEPPLPTNDIIGLLAFGGTTEQSSQAQQNNQSAFSQQASNAMLAAALNATLNNRAQRLFGNSRIKIDPQGLETETSPTQNAPAVTIEQQVKDNLTLTYTTSVSQTSQQIIRAEYNLSRNVSIVAIRDQNGVISFDVKIRRRKR